MWPFLLSLFSCGNINSQSKSEKISLETITEMFTNMHAKGVNTDTTMLWGYFFIADEQNQFDEVKKELINRNFDFVETYQAEDKSYWLHVERKETHNAMSLYELDEELYQIADKYKITYDGFDVGNVDKNKAIDINTYVVSEDFKTLDFQKDNFPYLLTGNTAFDRFPHKDEFYYFIKITTTYEKAGNALLPTNEELEKLDKVELSIESTLTQNKIKNYYVFRDTYKGIRNCYIVTNEKIGATEVIKSIKNSDNQRSFDFEVITDKTWSLYNEFRKKMSKE